MALAPLTFDVYLVEELLPFVFLPTPLPARRSFLLRSPLARQPLQRARPFFSLTVAWFLKQSVQE